MRLDSMQDWVQGVRAATEHPSDRRRQAEIRAAVIGQQRALVSIGRFHKEAVSTTVRAVMQHNSQFTGQQVNAAHQKMLVCAFCQL